MIAAAKRQRGASISRGLVLLVLSTPIFRKLSASAARHQTRSFVGDRYHRSHAAFAAAAGRRRRSETTSSLGRPVSLKYEAGIGRGRRRQDEVAPLLLLPPIIRRTMASDALKSTNRDSEERTATTTPPSKRISLEDDEQNYRYPPQLWDEYETAVREILQSRRLTRSSKKGKGRTNDLEIATDVLLRNGPIVDVDLPLLVCELEECSSGEDPTSADGGSTNDETSAHDRRIQFREQLLHQKEVFLGVTGLTNVQYDLAMRALSYLGDYCAKRYSLSMCPVDTVALPLVVGWNKMKEAGAMPVENSVSTYLYVLSSAEADVVGGGETSQERSNKVEKGTNVLNGDLNGHTQGDWSGEVAAFHDILFEPNEKTISVRVKSLIARGDAVGAEEILNTLSDDSKAGSEAKKLRTYQPILQHYCERNELGSALRVYKQMREAGRVIFDPETYVMLLSTLAENGYLRTDSAPITGAEELGYSAPSGPELFDLLATEMADDVLEINSSCARTLYDAFGKGFMGLDGFKGLDDEARNVLEVQSGEDNGAFLPNSSSELAREEEVVVGRVTVDGTTALCPRTGATLRLIMLEKDQRKRVYEGLMKMAALQHEAFVEKLKEKKWIKKEKKLDPDHGAKELSNFAMWLDEREGEPFTAIIDGANVAYFGHANIHYSQIAHMVDALEEMGEHPLVIMPHKYMQPEFKVNNRYVGNQQLSEKDTEVVNSLVQSGKVYRVPAKCLDDYYWMLASVSDQTKSRKGRDIDVPPNNDEARFPGLRPMLITNDQMRDHKLELLEARLFRRWCSCHIVNYEISSWTTNGTREIFASLPPTSSAAKYRAIRHQGEGRTLNVGSRGISL